MAITPTMKAPSTTSHLKQLDTLHLHRTLSKHFDKTTGAPHWIAESEKENIHINEDLTFEQFKKEFAFKNRKQQEPYEDALRTQPIENFIPKSTLENSEWLWAAETGGTTGIAKRGTWSAEYWQHILDFSDEFLDLHGVPKNENWLFIGPTGPHTTGRLLISITEHRGGRIFCIDMDPRIVRTYIQQGNDEAVQAYIKHLWEQVEPILRYQKIGVLFCTASLLEMMPQYIDIQLLEPIKAVLHAGLAMSKDTHKYLRETLFANKPVVGIYGTSVSGISYQKIYEAEDDYSIIYIPCQPSIVLEVIDEDGQLVDYDEEGDVRCFRFTDDQLIPGFIERDKARRIAPYGQWKERYSWDWMADPHSPSSISNQQIEGVY